MQCADCLSGCTGSAVTQCLYVLRISDKWPQQIKDYLDKAIPPEGQSSLVTKTLNLLSHCAVDSEMLEAWWSAHPLTRSISGHNLRGAQFCDAQLLSSHGVVLVSHCVVVRDAMRQCACVHAQRLVSWLGCVRALGVLLPYPT